MTLLRFTPLVRRTELRRGESKLARTPWEPERRPLPRHRELERKSKLRPRNPDRAARLFTRAYGSGERVEWIHSHPCVTCGRHLEGRMHASHVRSKGAGGDADDVVPQCWRCHHAYETEGRLTFERRRRPHMAQAARIYAIAWVAYTQAHDSPRPSRPRGYTPLAEAA